MKRTCEYKLQAVSQAKMTSNHAAARALGLEESTVRHWRRNEEKLKEQMRQVGIMTVKTLLKKIYLITRAVTS